MRNFLKKIILSAKNVLKDDGDSVSSIVEKIDESDQKIVDLKKKIESPEKSINKKESTVHEFLDSYLNKLNLEKWYQKYARAAKPKSRSSIVLSSKFNSSKNIIEDDETFYQAWGRQQAELEEELKKEKPNSIEEITSVNNPASSDAKTGETASTMKSTSKEKSADKKIIKEEEYYDPKEQLDNLYGGQKELESKNTIIKESNTEPKPSSDVPFEGVRSGHEVVPLPPEDTSNLKNGFNAKEYMEELKAGVQKNEDKSDFWKRAAIRNAEIAAKAYEENPTSKEALEHLQEMIKNPNSIEPGVMDYVATNPNAVKGVAGGAGLIALTNFLMSDRKGQMTNEELYSQ